MFPWLLLFVSSLLLSLLSLVSGRAGFWLLAREGEGQSTKASTALFAFTQHSLSSPSPSHIKGVDSLEFESENDKCMYAGLEHVSGSVLVHSPQCYMWTATTAPCAAKPWPGRNLKQTQRAAGVSRLTT